MAAALAVCLAIVFVAIHAAERTRRAGERSQRGTFSRTAVKKVDLAQSYDARFDPNLDSTVPGTEPADDPKPFPPSASESAVVGDATAGQLAEAARYLRRSEKLEGAAAISALRKVLDLKLPSTPEGQQILGDTHLRLAGLFDAASRKEYHLQRALVYTSDAALRSEIEAQIRAVGGTVPTYSTRAVTPRQFGLDDQCTNAIPISVPGSVTMSIDEPIPIPGTDPIEDHNFVTFDVPLVEPGNPHLPLVGQIVAIETSSAACSSEAECSNEAYDTALNLYAQCASDGFPDLRVATDEGPGDSGLGWFAALDGRGTCWDDTGKNTGEKCFVDRDCQASQGGENSRAFCASALCLPAGSYWVEASGDFGAAPQNFQVSVRTLGTCQIPRGDGYEVDNTAPDASRIGSSSSTPDQAGGFGRANKEIQSHTILADGTSIDTDYVRVQLSRDELVRFTTGVTLPRPNNGYLYRPAGEESDTELTFHYTNETLLEGGVCNLSTARTILPAGAASFTGRGCRSSATTCFGTDCYPGLGIDDEQRCGPPGSGMPPRFYGLPAEWCIPMYLQNCPACAIAWYNNYTPENPLAYNDNIDVTAGDYGSTLDLCIPKNGEALNANTYPMHMRATSSAANGRSPLNNYFYEMRAQPLTPCRFEREPNQSPFVASPIGFPGEAWGIGDISDTRLHTSVQVGRCNTSAASGQRCYVNPLPPGFTPPPFSVSIVQTCPSAQPCISSPTNMQMATIIAGFHDFDWWGPFDTLEPVEALFVLEPLIINANADTSLSLRVGPADIDGDGFDDYVVVATDENTGDTLPPSVIKLDELKPAAAYLADQEIPGLNPKYYLVGSILTNRGDAGSSIANYYYKLTAGGIPPTPETEPNNDCLTTPQTATVNQTWIGDLFPSGGIRVCSQFGICQDADMDAYRISIGENTRISFFTNGDPATTDTAIRLENCDTGTVVACDEDGQYPINGTYWSLLEGCLPPGDYCLRVRAWAGLGPEYFGLNGMYRVKFAGTPGCDPSGDPVVGDEAGGCRASSLSNAAPFDAGLDGDGDGYPARTACGQPLD